MKFFLFLFIFLNFSIQASKLNSSILLFNGWDLDNCQNQIEKAVSKLNTTSLQIMPTLHFKAKSEKEFKGFCLYKNNCELINEQSKIIFSNKIQTCISKAIEHNLNILYTPHLDHFGMPHIWRNKILFDPLEKYNGVTYKELFFDPIINLILNKKYNKEIKISMQGEMGATLFFAPLSYLTIYQELKNKLFSLNSNNLIGISFNYNKISGGAGNNKKNDLQELINQIDFIGLSAYAPMPVRLKEKHFLNSVKELNSSLKMKGLNLAKNKNLIFVEVGLGGGSYLNDGKSKANTPLMAIKNPYAGIWDLSDPNNNPWLDKKMKDFRYIYHKKLIGFLNNKILNHTVIEAYLWNANSWDPQGLYYGNEAFEDWEIIKLIQSQK